MSSTSSARGALSEYGHNVLISGINTLVQASVDPVKRFPLTKAEIENALFRPADLEILRAAVKLAPNSFSGTTTLQVYIDDALIGSSPAPGKPYRIDLAITDVTSWSGRANGGFIAPAACHDAVPNGPVHMRQYFFNETRTPAATLQKLRDWVIARYSAGLTASWVVALAQYTLRVCTTPGQLHHIWPELLAFGPNHEALDRARQLAAKSTRARPPEDGFWDDTCAAAVREATAYLAKASLYVSASNKALPKGTIVGGVHQDKTNASDLPPFARSLSAEARRRIVTPNPL